MLAKYFPHKIFEDGGGVILQSMPPIELSRYIMVDMKSESLILSDEHSAFREAIAKYRNLPA